MRLGSGCGCPEDPRLPPGVLGPGQLPLRVMDLELVALREAIRVEHEIRATGPLDGGEQQSSYARVLKQVRHGPSRWFDALDEPEPLPFAIPLAPQWVPAPVVARPHGGDLLDLDLKACKDAWAEERLGLRELGDRCFRFQGEIEGRRAGAVESPALARCTSAAEGLERPAWRQHPVGQQVDPRNGHPGAPAGRLRT